MHHLVMGERQNEVLVERIDQAEGELPVVVAPVDRILLHVRQRVVHPAHVPLEVKPETAHVGRPRDHRPRRAFLGHGDHARGLAVHQLVKAAHKVDRLQVLAPAVLVGHPLAGLAAVVQVEHRRHRIDTQPVEVILLAPEEGVGEQEVAHLVAPIVEDLGAPVLVFALARVGVFVDVGAVKEAQAVGIAWGSVPAPSPAARRCRAGGSSRRST